MKSLYRHLRYLFCVVIFFVFNLIFGAGIRNLARENTADISQNSQGLIPSSSTIISSFTYTETFDSGIGAWVQATGDDGNWTLNSGDTPSGGTGPDDDITGGGSYFYTEADNNQDPGPNAAAILESPCFNLMDYVNASFSFHYHMRGKDMGTLGLEVSDDDGVSWTELFSLSGEQENAWFQETIDLSSFSGSVIKLRFIGLTGDGKKSDMAIDQLVLTADPSETEPPTIPTNLIAINTLDVSTDLSWDASTDNLGVTGYDIYQDGVVIATATGTTYQAIGLSPNTTYAFSVVARDASGNASSQSDTVSVTTLDPIPCTGALISSFTYTETFDSGIGAWVQATGDDGNWTLNSGDTPSGGTGPDDDITGGGSYFYTEADNNQDPGPNAAAILESPCFNLMDYVNASFSFHYHMRGKDMGTLGLEVSDDDGVSWTELFSLSGEQENAWFQETIDLSSFSGSVIKLRFIGLTGDGKKSDMAIDQLVLTADPSETEPPTIPTNLIATNTLDVSTDLSWDASTDNLGVTGYDIYQDGVVIATATGTTYQAIGLSPNTTYAFSVVARDASGNASSQSDTVSVTTLDPIPCTGAVISSFTYTETFDSGIGAWAQAPGDDGNWTLNSGNTPSGGTGPDDDITGGGSYFYTEADNSQDPGPNATAILESPCFNLMDYVNASFSFHYHMRGKDMGTLGLEVSGDDGVSWTELFSLSGEQENAWFQETIDLSSFSGSVIKLRFIGLTGDGKKSDMAIDQLVLTADLDIEAPTAPTNLTVTDITQTTIDLSWDTSIDNFGVVAYDIYVDNSLFDTFTGTGTTYQATGLIPNTVYMFQVVAKDALGNESSSSNLVSVSTLDITSSYCISTSQSSNQEFISRVQINTIDNTSTGQTYSDFTNISTFLRVNTQYSITITPTWEGTVFDAGYSVWIDYNNDGDFFDLGEQVWTTGPNQNASVSGNFTVPAGALQVPTRMRISMKYNGISGPCEIFSSGEVEDYTIDIVDENALLYYEDEWYPNAPSDMTKSDNALIYNGIYNVNSNVNLNNLDVNSVAAIDVIKGQSISLSGNLTSLNSVTLNSDSDEYSSLIVDGSVIGDVFYLRHANTTAAVGGNDLIAPPVSGQSFIDFISVNPNIVSNSTNTLFLFGPFDKETGSYVVYSNTETATLDAGTGYRVASTNNSTFTFRGTVNTGPINKPIFNGGPSFFEWNLIGNPYPSYIKLSDFLAANLTEFDIPTAGVYGYDGNASDGWTIWNQAYSDANPNAIITPGQGFLVSSKPGGGTIGFTPPMRTIGNSDDFILGKQTSINPITFFKLQLSSGNSSYNTDFYFSDNASLGLDYGYDAVVFGGNAPAFSVYSELVDDNVGESIAVQSIGNDDLQDGVIIPLGINASQGQQLTLSIIDRTLAQNINVYLEDNLNNTFTLLSSSDYVFTADSNLSGSGRFYIRFSQDTLSTSNTNFEGVEIFNLHESQLITVKGQLDMESKLDIYDLQGRLVKQDILLSNDNLHHINTSELSAGVYVVYLQNKLQLKTQKIIIK